MAASALACAGAVAGGARPHVLRGAVALAASAVLGFSWAAWRAEIRIADELPAQWERRDIELIGVVASLPQHYDRGLRFEFDVETVLTPQAHVPPRIVLSWWGGATARDGTRAVPPLETSTPSVRQVA